MFWENELWLLNNFVLYYKFQCEFPPIVLFAFWGFACSLFKLQVQIREEWELEQKRQKEVEEAEKRKEAEKLKKQVCCPFMYVFMYGFGGTQ